MKITKEIDLTYFEFWSGAKDLRNKLTHSELKQISEQLQDLYPDGMTDTQVNDLFWFDDEFISEMINEDLEQIYNR